MRLTRLATIHRVDPEGSLLVNALSGAVDFVDNETRAKLLQLGVGRDPHFDEVTRAALVARRYLFAGEAEERAALAEVHEACRKREAGLPLQFIACPTYGCNLACSYCFESAQLRAGPEVMSLTQVNLFFAAVERIAGEHPGRQCEIGLFGGEPLLPVTMPVVEAIFACAQDRALPVQITSNGTHLADFVPLLARFDRVHGGVQVTVDGPPAVHDVRRKYRDGGGTFARIVTGVEAALAGGWQVNLRVNLDAHNLDSLGTLAEFIASRGWKDSGRFRCQVAPVTDHLGTSLYPFRMREDELVEPVLALRRERPEVYEILDFRLFRVLGHLIDVIDQPGTRRVLPRFHYCETDRGDMYTFGPDGLIYLCPESVGNRHHAVGSYAPRYNLHPERMAPWHQRSILSLPECRHCSIATFCGGGCGYAALKKHGTPMRGMCADAPEIVRAYARTLGARFRRPGVPSAGKDELPVVAQSC